MRKKRKKSKRRRKKKKKKNREKLSCLNFVKRNLVRSLWRIDRRLLDAPDISVPCIKGEVHNT